MHADSVIWASVSTLLISAMKRNYTSSNRTESNSGLQDRDIL